MRFNFIILIILLFCGPDLAAAQPGAVTTRKLKRLKKEIDEIQKELKVLESLEAEASRDFVKYESDMKAKMKEAAVPLLNWSRTSDDLKLEGWVEREHQGAVLDITREKIIDAPTRLLNERTKRLEAIQELRKESAVKLSDLEAKQTILQTQLEEWKRFQVKPKTQGTPSP